MPTRRMSPLISMILGLLLLLVSPAPVLADKDATAPGALPKAMVEQLQAATLPFVEQERIVGCSVGVIEGDARVMFSLGRLHVDRAEAPDADTVYEIGSVTKVFTGLLLAHAVGAGHVKLDTPAASLLDAEKVTLKTGEHRAITLLDLATHSSGLPRMPTNFKPKDVDNPYVDYDTALLYEFLNGHEPMRAPGAKYDYSNLATGLLGHVLARRAEMSYEALVAKHITGPLGMTRTRLALTADMKKRLAAPHRTDSSPAANWDLAALEGAGGIRSSLTDMMAFAASALAGGDTALGKAQTLARTKHVQAPGGPPMGLGWHLGQDGRCWHSGQTGGYHSFLGIDLAKRRAIVVLTNSANGYGDRLGMTIERVLDGKPVQAPNTPDTVEVDAKARARLVGEYVVSPELRITITQEGRRLMVQLTGQPAWRLFPASPTRWRYRVVEAHIDFTLEKEGPAKSLVLHQGPIRLEGSRAE